VALVSDLTLIGFDTRDADFLGDTGKDSIVANGLIQATATPITASVNNVLTVNFGVNDSVVLEKIVICKYSRVTIRNGTAFTLHVFPAVGDSIDGLATNAATNMLTGVCFTFCKVSTTKWIAG